MIGLSVEISVVARFSGFYGSVAADRSCRSGTVAVTEVWLSVLCPVIAGFVSVDSAISAGFIGVAGNKTGTFRNTFLESGVPVGRAGNSV